MWIDDILSYPAKRHIRTEAPPPFKTYDRFKPFLRREFRRTCVYCRSHDVLGGPARFAVEHYLCKMFFEKLETKYSNLFYACSDCNSKKSTWPYERKGGKWNRVSTTVPNPCDHVMSEHLTIDRATLEIRAKSQIGEFLIDMLALDRRAVEHRKLRDLFVGQRDRRTALRKRRKFGRRKLRSPKLTDTERQRIVAKLALVECELELLEVDFETNFGATP